MRVRVLSVTALAALTVGLTACGTDAPPAGPGNVPAATAPATAPATGTGGGANAGGLAGITFPAGAKVSDLGTNQKQYEVTGMTLEQVKTFFEDQMIAAGYTRAQEASASRFYDKGSRRIQITWSDQQGTIRGVVRVTR
jgi:predicted small lipoprotein YifL